MNSSDPFISKLYLLAARWLILVFIVKYETGRPTYANGFCVDP